VSVRNDLAAEVKHALQKAQDAGDLPASDIPEVSIEEPRQKSHGDYATPAGLEIARLARMAPIKIAEATAKHLAEMDYISQVDVAPPGYINFHLSDAWLQQSVDRILTEGDAFGRIELGEGKTAQVEFVSANPTGPITLGRTRGGVIGDTLARALDAAGYEVVREYYYNDAGKPIAGGHRDGGHPIRTPPHRLLHL